MRHLILVGVVALSLLHGEKAEGIRMCGRRLADLLNFICEKHGGFHAPRAKKDGAAGRSVEGEAEPSFRSGVVDECCKKQCTLATLVSYCAGGNFDLEDMLPPGVEETVPAISAEDLAEYQLQHDSTKSEESNAVLPRPHSSRPNLGQFMRNRPVFIVMSHLQEDEDRALGDYRF